MNRATVNRILDIQEQIQSEQSLMEEYRHHQNSFLKMLPELTERQRGILLDYLGVCVELHLRMLELACESEQQK